MNDHPGESVLLQHFDGTLAEREDRAVAAHVESCAQCRQHLAQLAAFEGFVASHMPGDALSDADMFEVAERALATRTGRARRRGWWGVFGASAVVLAAACIALMLWLQPPPQQERFRLVRYAAEDPLRDASSVRFHLELTIDEPMYVAAWLRFVDGSVVVLLPERADAAAVQGAVRLPANALLDWEYHAPQVPQEVLVVASPQPLAEPVRRELGDAWRAGAIGAVPSAAAVVGDARVLAVPESTGNGK